MRVLFVSPYFEPAYVYGGPARSIPALCRALVGQGVDVTVFTTDANGKSRLEVPIGRALLKDGVQVVYFHRLSKMRFTWSPGLARACRNQVADFDLVHATATFNYPSLAAVSAASARSVPVMLSLRGEFMPRALDRKGVKKAAYLRLVGMGHIRRAAALHCTDLTEKQAVRDLGFQNPVYVIPNGLDTRRYANLPSRGQLRSKWGIPEQAAVILFLGRLHDIKRLDLLVEGFVSIAQQFPQAHLVLAGPDESGLAAQLSGLAYQADCGERVHLVGLLDPEEVRHALSDADLFVMASESENFGLAVAEAMAAGLPVVISEKIGISRYVLQGDAGRIVSLTAASIAKGLADLLGQPERRQQMGRNAQRIAIERFDLAVVAQKTKESYAAILGQADAGDDLDRPAA